MAGTAFEHVILCVESSFTVQKASLAVGTSQFFMPLPESNAFQGGAERIDQDIAYGGGFDVTRETVSDHQSVKISFSTLGWPSLTAFLMNAACTRVNSGQTAPWTTTEPAGDLASIHAWHVFRTRAGTTITREYTGGKIMSLKGTQSRGTPQLKLSGDIVFSKELPNGKDSSSAGSAPTAPTEAQYPTGPYLLSHTSTGVTALGGTIASYESLSFSVTNKLDPRWFENSWVTTTPLLGREATADLALLFKTSPDARAAYLGLTNNAFKYVWNNGTNTQTLDYLTNNHVLKVPDDLPLGKVFMQNLSIKNKWDATYNTGAGGDLAVSNT